jgi:hypothetical protein
MSTMSAVTFGVSACLSMGNLIARVPSDSRYRPGARPGSAARARRASGACMASAADSTGPRTAWIAGIPERRAAHVTPVVVADCVIRARPRGRLTELVEIGSDARPCAFDQGLALGRRRASGIARGTAATPPQAPRGIASRAVRRRSRPLSRHGRTAPGVYTPTATIRETPSPQRHRVLDEAWARRSDSG